MQWRSVLTVALVVLTIGSSYTLDQAHAAPATRNSQMALFDSHISHIVFLMQENHAFDSLFGVYCPKTGTYCWSTANGVPTTCLPLNPAKPISGCVRPYNFTKAFLAPPDMEHDWISTHSAWDHGAMDNFYYAEGSTKETFGHYNGSTVPFYWELAEEYGLADDFFSSDASYSLANHWGMVASKPPYSSEQNYIGYAGNPTDQIYLNQSNHTKSIESSLLNSTSVSWKYYDFGLPPYLGAIGLLPEVPATAFDYWNPLAARAQSYQPHVKNHFVPRTSFFGDAANGTLPNISWIIPTPSDSDHPNANMTTGQTWVSKIVDAVEASPEWNSTVFFLTWDEYGGFYDHVAPPYLDSVGDGFRVPLIAVGPWVRQGYVSHVEMNFNSILRLMEDRFNLSCIGPRDCNAKVPLGMFNFSRAVPRAPIGFPTNGTWSYPMPLQSWGTLPYYGPGSAVPTEPAPPAEGNPDLRVLDWS